MHKVNYNARQMQKANFDQKVRFDAYDHGDLVWVELPRNKRMKLAPKWEGPFIVL